jgi:hypothetical protein
MRSCSTPRARRSGSSPSSACRPPSAATTCWRPSLTTSRAARPARSSTRSRRSSGRPPAAVPRPRPQPVGVTMTRPRSKPPRLLAGPYPPPHPGDRATCLYRDADVVVTSWTSAPIPWPRCCRSGTHGGGSGLLVTEELVRAIRTESAAALKHWWGVSARTVWAWRVAFGVRQWGTKGSMLLHQEISQRGGAALREHARGRAEQARRG